MVTLGAGYLALAGCMSACKNKAAKTEEPVKASAEPKAGSVVGFTIDQSIVFSASFKFSSSKQSRELICYWITNWVHLLKLGICYLSGSDVSDHFQDCCR